MSMTNSSVEAIVQQLNSHKVRYLIAGGLAVVAHGHVRFTADVDLVLAVDEQNLRNAVSAFKSLDYRPRAPVPFEQFTDPAQRQRWAREKNMVVFSLFSPSHPASEIDLFLEPPLDFEAAYNRAPRIEIKPGLSATFCSIEDLIAMKRRTGRDQDSADAEALRRLQQDNE
jgi:hypothetical protein